MQGAFIQSLTYNPPSVLGRQLKPFSPWHGLLLEAAGSPYLHGGLPDVNDLILGVWICTKSFSEGFRAAADRYAARKWGASLKQPQFFSDQAIFTEYISASFLTPQYWQGKEAKPIRAPYFWHLATFAMRDLHLSEQEAWDVSITRLACYQACVADVSGSKDLMSAEDIKGIEILKADEEKEKENKS
jgi:hypothetical protein